MTESNNSFRGVPPAFVFRIAAIPDEAPDPIRLHVRRWNVLKHAGDHPRWIAIDPVEHPSAN